MLTEEQIHDAVRQMIAHCDLKMEQYKAGVGEYATVSARGVLHELGFFDENVEQVLEHVAAGGFNYCLDHAIPCPDGERPSMSACYWGADQLESRLRCLRNVPYRVIR